MKIAMTDVHVRQAQAERDKFAKLTSPRLAGFVYAPANPKAQFLGLAAYAAFLSDLMGWNDTDFLGR